MGSEILAASTLRMRRVVVLFLSFLLFAVQAQDDEVVEEEEGHKLVVEEDEDDDTRDWTVEGMKAMPPFEQLIKHDCNTIRTFDWNNPEGSMEEWIHQNRKWGKKMKPFTKYNWAYGIPILGMPHFTDDAMKRACYLVRFLFAGNEQFRRYAYWSKMMIKGQRGGVCCPPNVNVVQLGCLCSRKRVFTEHKDINNFPIINIFAPAHEIGHWYIGRLLPKMVKNGDLTLPEFVKTTEQWEFKQPDGKVCGEQELKGLAEQGDMFVWLWNVLQQATESGATKIDRCKNHHFFIYSGQGLWGFTGHGPEQMKEQEDIKALRPNLYNLYKKLWPCNNRYISICEDSAHGMTKGLAQKLIIGKSDASDPSRMICLEEADKAEVEEQPVSSLPQDDVYEDDYREWYSDKCARVLKIGGWIPKGKLDALQAGVVAQSLQYSNERAWWLRKCCAKTAKFV